MLSVKLKTTISWFNKIYRDYRLIQFSVLNISLSLLQTIIITKFVTLSEYGHYTYYISLSQFLLVFTNWGFTSWGINELGKNSSINKSQIMTRIFNSRLVLGVLAVIMLSLYLFNFTNDYNLFVSVAFLIYVLSLAFSSEIIYIANVQIQPLLTTTIASRLILVMFSFVFLYMSWANYILLFFLFSAQSLLLAIILYRKQNVFDFRPKFSPIIFNRHVRDSLPNFSLILSSFIFASGPVLMAGHYLSKHSFGILYSAVGIIKLIQASYHPMIQKILPLMNNNKSIKHELKLALYFSIFMSCFVYIFARFVVSIVFGVNYSEIVPALKIFTWAIIPGIFNTIIISQYAVHSNVLRPVYTIVTILSFVFLGWIYIMIESFDWHFITWSMLTMEYLLFLLLILYLYKNKKLSEFI